MNKYRLAFIASLIILAAVGATLPKARGKQILTRSSETKSTSLYYYLDQLGAAYDHYFTIEASWAEGEVTRWMESYKLKRSPKKENLGLELEELRRLVPHFTYTIDQKNPKIIHIMDVRLTGIQGYGLESVLKSIDFTGTLPNLVNAISQQGISVSVGGSVFTSDYRPLDFGTEVHVKGEALKVRDALTHFIPLEGRGRVLWVARTKLGQQATSSIQFYGPAKQSSK